jgi:cell shape-determining protein MreC
MNLFPQNLYLGQVLRVTRNNVSLFQTAEIVPGVDFHNLELVQVVRNFVPSAPTKLVTGP